MNGAAKTGLLDHQVSCVIPAYNEARRIGAVISTVTGHPLISEVIVVDDGSTDETAFVAQAFNGVTVVRLSANSGKTRAVGAGLAEATGRYVVLIDADLVGLGADDLTRLIQPVLGGDADMSMSLRRNAPWLWHKIGLDYITGERVLPVELIADRMEELEELPRFGFEIWLNRICVGARTRIMVVEWDGVDSPIKVRKHGFLRGLRADAAMLLDLFDRASPLQLVRQIISMRRLRVPAPGRMAASPSQQQLNGSNG